MDLFIGKRCIFVYNILTMHIHMRALTVRIAFAYVT